MKTDRNLPDGWGYLQIKDVVESINSGGTPKRENKEYWKDGNIPWMKISDLTGTYVNESSEKITTEGLDNSSAKLFPEGTILYSIFATIGAIGILNTSAATNQAIAGLVPNNEIINTKYLYYCLKSEHRNVYAKKSHATQDNINLSVLKNHKIPVPPLDTQQRIVDLLDSMEDLRYLRKETLDISDQLIQSVFLEMFGDPAINSKEWEIKSLENLTSHVSSGSTPKGGSKVYCDSGILFIRSQNVLMNKLSFKDIVYIDDTIHHKMKRTWVKQGDVLFNITGASIGRVSYYPGKDDTANVNQHVCIIRPEKEVINPVFLSYLMSMDNFQKKIFATQSGATRQAFNYTQIKKFDIVTPPLHLQQQFADFVQSVEDMKSSQVKSAETMDEMFNSFLDKAFRGELIC
jgi:type I restriction enzyme S subunit